LNSYRDAKEDIIIIFESLAEEVLERREDDDEELDEVVDDAIATFEDSVREAGPNNYSYRIDGIDYGPCAEHLGGAQIREAFALRSGLAPGAKPDLYYEALVKNSMTFLPVRDEDHFFMSYPHFFLSAASLSTTDMTKNVAVLHHRPVGED